MLESNITKKPASWVDRQVSNGAANGHTDATTNGNAESELPVSFLSSKAVRTVYGPVPLNQALDWPVFASYDELAACAAWMGGRIPTAEEAQSIYAYVDYLKRETAENTLGKTLPAVNACVASDSSMPSHESSYKYQD